MDQSAQNLRTKHVPLIDIAPLEIIDKEDDEDFINAAVVENNNQIDLVIHIIHHDIIYQYWSLKSEGDSGQLNSSACHHQHHRDSHHLRDGDDDEEMIMINCQPANTPYVLGKLLVDRGVFGSYDDDDYDDDQIQDAVNNNADDEADDHADNNDDNYIMSLLHDMDVLYECRIIRIRTYEHLQEMKRSITQRISEAKPAVLMARPKRVRIRVHLATILKSYYANSAAANSAAAQEAIELRIRDECSALSDHLPSQQRSPAAPQSYEIKPASRSSKEALKTKIFEKGDLISSSSSSCPVCWIEFRVGVDEIMIMPCSHVFHSTCLCDWLLKRNTCPLCRYELPIRQLPSSRWKSWNCLTRRWNC